MPKKILVIDDKHDIRALVCKFLNKKGFFAFRAKNAWQGLRLASRFLPDLILLDISMPLINGFTVLKRLKESEKTMHIPIIMLTGRDDDNSKEKWINRRSQKNSYNWVEFWRFLRFNPLPKPRIYHALYTLSSYKGMCY